MSVDSKYMVKSQMGIPSQVFVSHTSPQFGLHLRKREGANQTDLHIVFTTLVQQRLETGAK